MVLPHDDYGDGEPLVLLHAGIADRTMYTEQLGPLAEAGLRSIAVDLPGFGEASLPDAPRAPWLDLLETLDALGVERAALAGCSFGGAVALRVAAVAPERVTALALFSAPGPSTGKDPSPRLQAAWEAEEGALQERDLDGAVAAVLDAWTLPDAPQALRDRVATMQRRAFEIQSAAAEPADAPDPVEEDPAALSRLRAPALVAVGALDMPDFQEAASEIAALLTAAQPPVRHEVVANAGHLIPLEAPESFRELVRSLVR
jgi:pimeloyl-ACP methyl ester carboxylesterase